MRRSIATALLLISLAACSAPDRNPVEPAAQPKAVASTEPPPPTTPAAPAPAPTAAPEPINRPPAVSLSFVDASACHPRKQSNGRVISCAVELRADAKDPDGDPITYSWSGCTSGSDRTASCVIDSPRSFAANVEVRDSHGASDRATRTAQGVNRPPFASLTPTPAPFRAGRVIEIYGAIQDPDDGGVCGREWCVRAQGSGACGPSVFLDCTCLADLYAEVRPHSAGTCTVEVTLKDDWGLEGKSVLRIDVGAQ
jgi:hypothetical protein